LGARLPARAETSRNHNVICPQLKLVSNFCFEKKNLD
jgi:hypothetical protein